MDSYWTSTLTSRRINRRHLVSATAAGTAAAAFLAACGGSGKKGPTLSELSKDRGLIAGYVDTTKQAVSGGIYQSLQTSEAPSLDPLTGMTRDLNHGLHVYSRLLDFKVGTVFNPPNGAITGNAATAWEVSPDGLQVTLKLRQGMKFDARPPTNGRILDSSDVKFSFDRFAALSPTRGSVINSVVPTSSVVDMTAPDANTVVFKLAFPDSSILSLLAWSFFLNIEPVEAKDKFDPRGDMRGSGPWMLTKYEPSIGWSYRKNPDWWRASQGVPYLDGIDYALINQTPTALAQFKAKRLWAYTPSPDAVVQTKKDVQEALLYATSPLTGNAGYRFIGLSKLENSPIYKDVRIRRAINVLMDRDAMLDSFGNVSGFGKEGVEVESAIHSHVPSSWDQIWVDPRTKLGDSSKFWQHDPALATQLLKAANAFGMETDWGVWTDSQLPNQQGTLQAMADMLQSGGHFKLNTKSGPLATYYQPIYQIANYNAYEGLASYQAFGAQPDWTMTMWFTSAPGGRAEGLGRWEAAPGLQDVMEKARKEQDPQRRIALGKEWQQIMSDNMPWIVYPWPGGVTSFSMKWPWFQNFGVYQSWNGGAPVADAGPYWWYDKTKDTRSA